MKTPEQITRDIAKAGYITWSGREVVENIVAQAMQQAREQALEEAAKLIEANAERYGSLWQEQANAIRNLKTQQKA